MIFHRNRFKDAASIGNSSLAPLLSFPPSFPIYTVPCIDRNISMIDWFAVFINNPHHQQYCEWCNDSICYRYISMGIRCCCLCCLQPATCIWLCFPRTCGNYIDSCNWPSVSLVCRIGQSRLGLAMTVPVWFGLNASLVYGTLAGGGEGVAGQPACLHWPQFLCACMLQV